MPDVLKDSSINNKLVKYFAEDLDGIPFIRTVTSCLHFASALPIEW